MPETVLERHYRDRVESVRQMALPEHGGAARSWREYEDLIALCCELAESGRALLEQEYHRIFEEHHPSVGWLRERRRVIEELSDSYVRLAEAVKAMVLHARTTMEIAPDGAIVARLDDASRLVIDTRQRVLQRWPVGTDAETAAAQAAAARGEGLDLDEAFAQIAGVDVPTWRRRIEESKREPRQ